MSPWVHQHIHPNGNVFACCWASSHSDQILGNLNQNSLPEIWNSGKMRDLRQRMLAGERSSICEKCYELEARGAPSYRQEFNAKFAHWRDRVTSTAPDGSLSGLETASLDVRFSNVCNLKCRTCGPELSSKWAEDVHVMNGRPPRPVTIKLADLRYDPIPVLLKNLHAVEEIYFAGGEPLLMREHYQLLQKLLEMKRTDIRIKYSTNLAALGFAGVEVTSLWRHFEHIEVGASLDAEGPRAAYLRKGTDWRKILDNRAKILVHAPHVDFFISATVSAFNFHHLPDFVRSWVDKGLISNRGFYANRLFYPDEFDLNHLPVSLKREAREKWIELAQTFERHAGGQTNMATQSIAHIIASTNLEEPNREAQGRLIQSIKKMDGIRGENILDSFPELRPLFEDPVA